MIRDWDIYSYYDGTGVCLYIGISGDALERQKQHLRNADNKWKSLYTRMEREVFNGTRKELEEREKCRIKNEKPIYNVTHNYIEKENDKVEPVVRTKQIFDRFKILSQECIPYYKQFISLMTPDSDIVSFKCPESIGHELFSKILGFKTKCGLGSIHLISSHAYTKGENNISEFKLHKEQKQWCILARDNNDIWFENVNNLPFYGRYNEKLIPYWKKHE